MNKEYSFEFDLVNKEILYKPLDHRHGYVTRISYKEISNNSEIMNMFSGKDAYLIGVFYASNSLKKILVKENQFNYRYLILISVLFASIMMISNILSTKLTVVFGHTITGAMLVYPFSYIFDYIITDVYGYQNARRIIISVVISLVLFDFSFWVVTIIPPSPYWHFQKELQDIFQRMYRTFLSSTFAFVISFFVSSYILQKYKIKNVNGSLFKRIFRSLLVSEIFDTGLFCFLSFYGIWPLRDMLDFLMISYFTKLTYELIMYSLVTRPIINFIKNKERLDTVDIGTNFTPFSWVVDYNEKNNVYKITN